MASLTVLSIGVSYLLLRTAIKNAEKHLCPKKPGLDPMLRTVGDVTDCPKPGVIYPWLRTVGEKQTLEIWSQYVDLRIFFSACFFGHLDTYHTWISQLTWLGFTNARLINCEVVSNRCTLEEAHHMFVGVYQSIIRTLLNMTWYHLNLK